jgi:hypothetical protein
MSIQIVLFVALVSTADVPELQMRAHDPIGLAFEHDRRVQVAQGKTDKSVPGALPGRSESSQEDRPSTRAPRKSKKARSGEGNQRQRNAAQRREERSSVTRMASCVPQLELPENESPNAGCVHSAPRRVKALTSRRSLMIWRRAVQLQLMQPGVARWRLVARMGLHGRMKRSGVGMPRSLHAIKPAETMCTPQD